ncbi:MAG: endopeptidase La [Acidobacteria bacterium ACB1]|nr:Lon protease 1 [Pyrinomonadaceae bacterium]MCE7962174.1 endopeptidase La [Acidobacteria bacterium ACB1]RIJ89496.1 MAG: endopeptidase La [Acidobacteriota bacterium]
MQEFSDQMPSDVERFPMVPIRDVVIFPFTKVAFKIGRPSSVAALERAMSGDRHIFLATQHDATVDEPTPDQIYQTGTLGRIVQAQRQDNGQIKVVVEGRERGRSLRVESDPDGILYAFIRKLTSTDESGYRTDGSLQRVHALIENLMRVSPDAYTDALHSSLRGVSAAQIADSMASHLRISVEDKQAILELVSVQDRLTAIIASLEAEIEKRQLDRNIHSRTKKAMDKHQREYYLNEQIKAIHKELGRKDEKADLDELKKKIEEAGMTAEAKDKAMQEFSRLESMPPMSAEGTVSRTYIDWLVNVPWQTRSEEVDDLSEAEATLNEDHFGLEKIKERILEFLAVRQLVKNPKGTILCFVGAPGVGKTSLGKSIANATGRKFVRMALGGVHDEAEIRGHRRTYIGSMPGQVIQLLKRAGTVNPVILLDEVDKLGRDYRGDPSAALLEVLDPEQNCTFRDHYLDVDYDLSSVFFIATANVLHSIPAALQDRLEILNLSGYTEREKTEIAKRHLIPKQCENTGIDPKAVSFTDDGILDIIRHYTRESGVRTLERQIGSCLRKIARKSVTGMIPAGSSVVIDAAKTRELLGTVKYRKQDIAKESEVGLVNGLAWTEVGGDVLQVEATLVKGKGEITLTGKLGEVMQESARAALTCVRARAERLGIDSTDFREKDLHIHVPEGAIPKDGPSAGITMAVAMVSALTGKRVRGDVAMTGEITLRGKVLPIGGLKEKMLAAHRFGLNTLVIPRDNEKDLADIPAEVCDELTIHIVDDIDEVFQHALEPNASDAAGDLPQIWAPDQTGGDISSAVVE